MLNDDLEQLYQACMKVVDELDKLIFGIIIAKVILEEIKTRLMFDLDDGD